MSAKPRDLLKSRATRLGEVLHLNGLKAGQSNSQVVLWGNLITPTAADPDTFDVSAGEYMLAQTIVQADAASAVAITGADTTASEYRKVLVERDADGDVSVKIGVAAASQADAELPLGDTDKISIGWIEIPASFTVNTTDITVGMIQQMDYHA